MGWEDGIERAIQRVIAGMCAFYSISAGLWATSGPADASTTATILMVAGFLTLAAITVRAWRTRIGLIDLVAVNVAMIAMLRVNAEIGTSGIGIQAGPAYVFMTTSLLIAALTLMWTDFWRWASFTTAVYVIGRYLGDSGGSLWSGLDEAISDTSTIAAAGLILTYYRRAGRRADEALRVRRDAGRREAHAAAVERTAADERRLLHDEIISALVTIELSAATHDSQHAAEAAARARRSLDLDLTKPAAPAHVPEWLINTSDLSLPVTLDIDPGISMSGSLPPHVTVAMTGAANEALRNVERHADAQSVHVTVAHHGTRGVRVTISDDGRGLTADHSPGFGIKQSIIGRLEEVGGTAHVHAAAGGGTAVELTWSGHDDGPPPHPAESVSAIGSPHRFAYSVTAVALVGQLWLVGRHIERPLEVVVALASVAFILVVARTVAHHRLGTWSVVAIFVVDAALLAAGLFAAGDGALLDFRSWIVEMTCVLIFTVTFFVSFRAMLALAAMLAAVMMAWTAYDPAITLGQVSDPVLQPIFYAAALGATAWGFRRVSVTIADEERRAAHQIELEATHAAIGSRDRQRFDHLRARLDPFFQAIETGATDVTRPEVADRARTLALLVRDEMYLPGLLDDDLRLLLATARDSGTSITIRETASDDTGEAVRLLLKVAIDPINVSSATLSLPSTGAPYIRLVLVPAASAAHRDRLTTTLDPWGAQVESLEHATVITLGVDGPAISPTGALRPAPWSPNHESFPDQVRAADRSQPPG